MSFTPTKYELKLTIDFNELTFTGDARIHVDVTDSVKEFDLKISKDLKIERVSFWQAQHIHRGHPNTMGSNVDFQRENDSVHVTLLSEIDAESIKEEGYIQVEYKGKIGESEEGLHLTGSGFTFEANLTAETATSLLPILEDIPVNVTLSVVTPYRAGVETNIPTGEHRSVDENLFSNNFTSGDDKILISDVQLRITAPTALILE
ncbi:hypothetical protein B9Z55_020577 [Caenorhabditis nigoni]|uniref:Aminopeptidase N-like N-terminal domain-containing protein n=1 Tax=Caenorhabditis nigoni TaxID=1611254 RepID=A0A2G5TN95_9PELO|nr:hypothetical protein B9Z55_020577 [Caenorhabditis nigoni]